MPVQQPGYMGKLLRVDLSGKLVTEVPIDAETMKGYLGGTGLGARYLWEEVPAGVEWSDPENRLILATGPLAGTRVMGSSNISVVTKGPLTNGATSTQANGFFAAHLRFCGYEGIIVQGRAPNLTYLYIRDDGVEIRDASRLAGKDTKEVGDILRHEVEDAHLSVLAIGPAGEKLVKFAGIISDGHSASHNGVGAVMGSKNLKAVVVPRGKQRPVLHDQPKLSALVKEMLDVVKQDGWHGHLYRWGTSKLLSACEPRGFLSVRNYQSTVFPEHTNFSGQRLRSRFEVSRQPCWACQMQHCHHMKVTEGPYAGYEGEEPEFTIWAQWGPNIGVTDPGAALMLGDVTDRLGLDVNEAGWMVSWLMECYQKELVTSQDLGGVELTWGNAEAVRSLLHMIAERRGYGDVLAEGLKRAAEDRGGAARDCAVYTARGNSPTARDLRASWDALFDVCVSNTGCTELGELYVHANQLGLEPVTGRFSPEQVSTSSAQLRGGMQFYDSLGVCVFANAADMKLVVDMLNAATGWDFSLDEAMNVGRRAVNLMRVFNVRHGLTAEQERPSTRMCSAPSDGPARGISIAAHWDRMRSNYYQHMGWDPRTCRPLPDTLRQLGMDYAISEVSDR